MAQIRIPHKITELAGWGFQDEKGNARQVRTRRVLLECGALSRLGPLVREAGLGSQCWALCDPNTWKAAGERVVAELRAHGLAVESTILEPDRGEWLEVDDRTVDRARALVPAEASIYLGVGAGAINDIARLLVPEHGGVHYLSVPTAASVNGYGSPISAVIEKGIKLTKPSAQTEAIVADLDVLCDAPVRLAQSGFGDLLAKNSSNADWFVAGQITGDAYLGTPVAMVRQASARSMALAGGVGRREPRAIEALMEGLIAGAFAMDVAGVTAPASGGEHLVSHYLEMLAHEGGYAPCLHGEQVALGTLIATALYQKLGQLDITKIDVDELTSQHPTWESRESQVCSRHGKMAEIVMEEARQQHLTTDAYRSRLRHIVEAWPGIRSHLREQVVDAGAVSNAYREAGTPTTARQLGIDGELVRKSYRLAKDMRNRYTVLHLAADLGVLEAWEDEVMALSGVLG